MRLLMESQFNRFRIDTFQSELLKTKTYGRYFMYRERTDSTMNIAKTQINDGCPEGTIVLAEEQTAGRGREKCRTWDSERGQNLLFTLVCYLQDDPTRLLFASALSICKSLRKEGVNAWIKWPNDVWVSDKKISGLLIDSSNNSAGVLYQSLGVGINVNEDLSKITDRCSVSDITGKKHSREVILANMLNYLESFVDKPKSELLKEYREYEGLVGQQVIVMPKKKENPETWEGKVTGYDDYGFLRVFDGKKENILVAEEVTIRPEKIKTEFKNVRFAI